MKQQMIRMIRFFQKETVLCIAALLSVLSAFIVPPSKEYLEYIDWRVLALLFGLMLVVKGLQSVGLFQLLGVKLLCRVFATRRLCLLLASLCFFSSMLLTNDVALITFVPFAVMVLSMAGEKELLIPAVVLQTLGANLGSMLTPVGNPQNLYLYSKFSIPIGRFLWWMLPLTILSFLLLAAAVRFLPDKKIQAAVPENAVSLSPLRLTCYLLLFLIALSCVVRLISWPVMLATLITAVFFLDKKLFRAVDYYLLLTFVCFFLFIGNMERIPAVSALLRSLLDGREFWLSLLLSQGISNVPAAILLSGFTDKARPLLYGVNAGGLGTLIASLASVISFQIYGGSPDASKRKYLKTFTVYNLLFLIPLSFAALALLRFL